MKYNVRVRCGDGSVANYEYTATAKTTDGRNNEVIRVAEQRYPEWVEIDARPAVDDRVKIPEESV